MPEVHSSELKKSLTSNIDMFDMSALSWTSVATTGEPPAAVMDYSSCSLGNKIYYFGGSCMPDDCYHNDLFTLDTLSKDWRQVDYISSPTSSPMKKYGHEMASFTVDSEDYLFVFGRDWSNTNPYTITWTVCSLSHLDSIDHTQMKCTCCVCQLLLVSNNTLSVSL